jgi:hypothetical protein
LKQSTAFTAIQTPPILRNFPVPGYCRTGYGYFGGTPLCRLKIKCRAKIVYAKKEINSRIHFTPLVAAVMRTYFYW